MNPADALLFVRLHCCNFEVRPAGIVPYCYRLTEPGQRFCNRHRKEKK